mmetsp:Transcript_140020/g.261057  ORF Transcript_140020/g.261057 Transcript_140020/m.261057 type:complete len:138 (+) Transcript_140020:227-640(+)
MLEPADSPQFDSSTDTIGDSTDAAGDGAGFPFDALRFDTGQVGAALPSLLNESLAGSPPRFVGSPPRFMIVLTLRTGLDADKSPPLETDRDGDALALESSVAMAPAASPALAAESLVRVSCPRSTATAAPGSRWSPK